MIHINSVTTTASQNLISNVKTTAAEGTQTAENSAPAESIQPKRDEYRQSEEHTPIGQYQVKQDSDGNKTVEFDRPEKKAENKSPVKLNSGIEKKSLEKKISDLKIRIAKESDPIKQAQLNKKLAKLKNEYKVIK